jgi:hypothetical protein
MQLKKFKDNYYIILLFISLCYFFLRWGLSFLYFPQEDSIIKLLFDSSDSDYYPLVKKLSELNFKINYNLEFDAKKIISFPIGSLIWHALFYKLFGILSFPILEFFFFYIFLILIFKIYNELGFKGHFALLASLLLVTLVYFVQVLSLYFDNYYFKILNNNLKSLFSLRFPRPLVTNIYFWLSALLVIRYLNFNDYKKITFFLILITILLSFLGNSFYFLFFNLIIAIILYIFFLKKKNILIFYRKNITFILILFLILLFFLSPFFLQIYYGEPDYSFRLGVRNIDLEKKFLLIKYLLKSFIKIEFLLIFFINIFFIIILRKNKYFVKLVYFFLIYIASILSPFIFLLISNKIVTFQLFVDYIFINSFISIYILMTFFIFNKLEKKKFNFFIRFLLLSFIFFTIFFKTYLDFSLNIKNRINYDSLNKLIIKNNLDKKNYTLFTNDRFVMKIWIIKFNNNLSVSDGFVNSLDNKSIESSFFNSLKSLQIDNIEFSQIINFKFNNNNHYYANYLFHYGYFVNPLFNNYQIADYDIDEQSRIANLSPLRNQYSFFSKSEKKRFLESYSNYNFKNKSSVDLIIINKNYFPDILQKKFANYDLIENNDNFIVLLKK